MRLSTVVFQSIAIAALLSARPLEAQIDASGTVLWTHGPAVGRLGDVAEVEVPSLCKFTDARGTAGFLQATGELWTGRELGVLICHAAPDDEGAWYVLFTHNAIGFVRDDEKSSLDPDRLLAGLRHTNDSLDDLRRQRGGAQGADIIGWKQLPTYDPLTHTLTWATRLRERDTSAAEAVSHATRILGRRGAMNIDFAADSAHEEAAVAMFAEILSGFSFVSGQQYSDWRRGDRTSDYGLTTLVVGTSGKEHSRIDDVRHGLAVLLVLARKRFVIIVATGLVGFLIWLISRASKERLAPSANADAGT
jgi:uncharacterized membrane-anchored protein